MKKNYFKSVVVMILVLMMGYAQAQNCITDGDFSATTEIPEFFVAPQPLNQWFYWLNHGEGVEAAPIVDQGVCKFEIVNGGSNSWSIQLMQWGFPLIQDHAYELSFDVKADADRAFGVFLGEDGGYYTNLTGDSYWQEATTEWQTITIPFETFAVFPLHKLSFELGTNTITTYFDNISLIDLGPIQASQNLIVNGDFSTATDLMELATDPPPVNNWLYYINHDEGVEGTPVIEDGVCKFEMWSAGFNTWSVQLAQWGFPLVQGHAYELSFDVKADAYRSFGIFLGENGGSWTNLVSNWYLQNATPEWQTITIPLEAFADFPLHKLSFELGTDTATMYFDNVSLIDLGMTEYSIGILGTAVNGWYDDVDMETMDGINYTLANYPLQMGEMKFRQDNTWDVNWGNNSFPHGFGIPYGPNIVIPYTANFDIAFNRYSGEYNFECVDNCPASIGMVGPALNGWDNDVDMLTNDGSVYMLSDFYFSAGEAKFRQDGNWDVNWGGDTFPSGWAVLNGPNIPVEAGFYNVTFNLTSGEYNFTMPSIGILGTALNGWEDDIDMESDDGIIYTINDLYLNYGEVKFRQDNNWVTNWGGDNFPMGVGYQNGPNIVVLEGTYDITFNKMSGEYNFVATTCPYPEITCPMDIYTINDPGTCGAMVTYSEVVPVANCGGEGVTITQTEGLPSGSLFPVGTTINTFEITNETGEMASCSFNVTVWDTEAPVITYLNQDYEPLWPPNHQMVDVFIDYTVYDNCETTAELFIYSNEPENGLGDGDQSPDWEVVDDHHVLLRAERSGLGHGREYYILILIYDAAMNYTFETITVRVPHDKRFNENASANSNRGKDRVVLYPNAADQYINLRGLKEGQNHGYQIYNMYGLIKDQGVLNGNQINVSELSKGMYILRLETNEGQQYKTFIKN